MNAANIMKPALSRGDAGHRRDDLCGVPQAHREGLGARTPFSARHRSPSRPSRTPLKSIAIIRVYYEKFHCVVSCLDPIDDGACVQLSERYITDRFLPDKAIDLIDEACPAATCANKKSQNEREKHAEYRIWNFPKLSGERRPTPSTTIGRVMAEWQPPELDPPAPEGDGNPR